MSLRKYSLRKWMTFVRYRLIKQRVPDSVWRNRDVLDRAILGYKSKMVFPTLGDTFNSETTSEIEKLKIYQSAQYVLDDRIPVLTDAPIFLGEQIAWNKDYVTNIECTSVSQAKSKGADIKRVWELSRMHQLTPLMKAFILSGESRYTEKIKSIIRSWIAENPYGTGPNWINPMEIAIRSVNVMRTVVLCPTLSEDQMFIDEVNHLLLWSGIHIRCFLENTSLVNNNHYLSDLTGLAFIGAYFQGCPDIEVKKMARQWRMLSYREINKELKTQILDDGTSFEKSTSYHAYVLEILLWSYRILELNTDFDLSYIANVLRKMYVFLNQINGIEGIPFVGDNDNSRLFRDDLEYPFENQRSYKYLLDNCRRWLKINDCQYKDCYKDSGYYFLRNNKLNVLVCCGPLSLNGGHCHNDQLSYVLWYNGIRITDDPGSYCYTSDISERNKFRGTGMHSTVQFGKAEQNELVKCFEVKENTNATCVFFSQTSFEGAHYGYKNQFASIVRRRIEMTENRVNIWDSVENDIEAISRIIFSQNVVLNGNNTFRKDDICFRIEAPEKSIEIKRVEFSPSYGVKEETFAIEMSFKRQIKYSIVFMEETGQNEIKF